MGIFGFVGRAAMGGTKLAARGAWGGTKLAGFLADLAPKGDRSMGPNGKNAIRRRGSRPGQPGICGAASALINRYLRGDHIGTTTASRRAWRSQMS